MFWFKQLKKIYVDRQVKNSALVKKILDHLPNLPVRIVSSLEEIQDELRLAPDPVSESKRMLFLTREKYFIRPCPCTPGCVSCDYWTLDLNLNCPLDCSYCILQAYFNHQPLTIAVNQEEIKKELEVFFSRQNKSVIRLGTGELGDSLALDSLTGQAVFLAGLLKGRKRSFLELKTKTAYVEPLIEISPSENLVLSWSLNTKRIINSEEAGSASLEERLATAARAAKYGYKVGFHFDPIIYYSTWEKDYEEVIEELFKQVPVEAIAWVSLGTLRFPAKLKEIARARFPHSLIYEAEFIQSWDGKFRYPRPVRVKVYKRIKEIFETHNSGDRLYLCMESSEVWRDFKGQNKKGKPEASPFPWLI
ncbi:MAG: radical SAM protein [Acidobacteriota bacterium]|nr:radical SAM protein [Acidobacteriota bacterium]